MTAFRVARLMCDLCRRAMPGTFPDTRTAKKHAAIQGWRTAKLPNSHIIDVCAQCALDLHVGYFIHRPGRLVERAGYESYRTGLYWSRRFLSAEDARTSPQFDDHSMLVRADIKINPNSKRLMTVTVTELATKAEYDLLKTEEAKS
jgi:hypothetical protein